MFIFLFDSPHCVPQKSVDDVKPSNEFERKLLEDVVLSTDIGVSFEGLRFSAVVGVVPILHVLAVDIGALEETKSMLREVISLPLQRPELFGTTTLDKPPKGVLLFGPPG